MNNSTRGGRSVAEKRGTWLAVAGGVAGVMVALGSLGSIYYLREQARSGNYSGRERVNVPLAPALASEQHGERLAKASLMRDKWRSWVVSHTDALKRMRSGSSSGLSEVVGAIPGIPDPKVTGFGASELNSGATLASWQLTYKAARPKPGDEASAGSVQRAKEEGAEAVRYYFGQEHDVMVSWMTHQDIGKPNIVFWASGRITEMRSEVQRDASGRPVSAKPVFKELAPAYEFLG